jgi:hypothetical protein
MILCTVADPPRAKDLLGPKETIIDPYYMKQLLVYAINLGRTGQVDPERDDEKIEENAEVVHILICSQSTHSLISRL